MSLLEKIKSALGMEGAESESTGGNTQSTGESGVTVERETETKAETDSKTDTDTDIDDTQTDVDEKTDVDEGDGEVEEKGKQDEEDEGETEVKDEEGDEGEAEEVEEDEGEDPQSPEVSGTMVDPDAGVETGEVAGQANTQTGPADEPGEATGPTSTNSPGPATGQSDEVSETETGDVEGGAGVETEDHDTGEPDSDSEPVDVIKGVGATYAETLGEEDIESVADLASADPETLSEETGISLKRIERWIGRAQHR